MTNEERALLLLVAEHMAALLEADAEAHDEESSQAELIRTLVAKVLQR